MTLNHPVLSNIILLDSDYRSIINDYLGRYVWPTIAVGIVLAVASFFLSNLAKTADTAGSGQRFEGLVGLGKVLLIVGCVIAGFGIVVKLVQSLYSYSI